MKFIFNRKCLLIVGIFALFQTGCSKEEKLVKLSAEVTPKTVDIHVSGIMEVPVFTIKQTKRGIEFSIEKATVPVTIEGAGVFVSENNHVLTCAHLFWLTEVTGITVCRENGQCTAGELLAIEDRNDLALVGSFFDGPTPYARLADPRKLKVGQEVLAVGSPLGFAFSVSHGIVSALNRDGLGVNNMTQSDAFLNPGNSGGPLFNMKGEIVGINSRIVPPVNANIFTGLGFSVQSGQIIEFLTRFRGIDKSFPKYDAGYWEGFLNAIGWRN
jgi:S1-C subfamily serine protease